jgi:hypothetical protein
MDSACPVNASEYLGHLTLIADASQLVDRPDEYGRQVPIDFIIDDVNGDSSIRKFASRIGAYMKQPGLRGSKIDAHRRRLATRAVHKAPPSLARLRIVRGFPSGPLFRLWIKAKLIQIDDFVRC